MGLAIATADSILRTAICCLGLALSVANAHAQGVSNKSKASNGSPDSDRRQVVPFLDATYVGFGRATTKDSDDAAARQDVVYTFEADIVPNFVVRQTFFDSLGQEETKTLLRRQSPTPEKAKEPSEWRFAYSIAAVPMVRLRMFVNERSSPVRTPSYMPKGTGQLFMFKLHERKVDLFGAQVTVGHHSNGQDGCLSNTQQRESDDDDADCVPELPVDRTRLDLNRKDGSFSTNYMTIGGRYRYIKLDAPAGTQDVLAAQLALREAVIRNEWSDVLRLSDELRNKASLSKDEATLVREWHERFSAAIITAVADPQARAAREAVVHAGVALIAAASPIQRTSSFDATAGIDLELNPGDGKFLGGGGINPDLKARYGATRVSFLGALAWRMPVCARTEVKGFFKYIHHPAEEVPSAAGAIEGQCLFKQTNWGLFARFYGGQDYYNLGFQDNVRRFQFGMTYSQEGFLRFRTKPVSQEDADKAAGN